MGGIDGFVNNVNQFTQSVGAIQGAMDTAVPALYAVENSVNQIASVFTGDTYNPYPGNYPPPMPMPVDPGRGKIGMIGSILSGGVSGMMTHKTTAEAFKTFKTVGAGAGMKALGISSLKAGGIGAAVSGVASAAKNLMMSSRGEQTGRQAGGNIAADTIGGLLAGATGGIAAGAASLALGSAGGILGTIGIVAAGALGGVGANLLYEKTGIRDKVYSAISGDTLAAGYGYGYQQPAYGYQQPGYGYGGY